MLPRGKTARATRAVSAGTGVNGWGCSDIDLLLSLSSKQKSFTPTRAYATAPSLREFASSISMLAHSNDQPPRPDFRHGPECFLLPRFTQPRSSIGSDTFNFHIFMGRRNYGSSDRCVLLA